MIATRPPLARTARGAGAVQAPLWPVEEERPAPAHVVIAALHRALYAALVPRADGSRHDRGCINRHVNAIPRACSPACEYATGALLLAEELEELRG